MDKNAKKIRAEAIQRNAKFWAAGFWFVGNPGTNPQQNDGCPAKCHSWKKKNEVPRVASFLGVNFQGGSSFWLESQGCFKENMNLIRSTWESVKGHIAKTQPISAIMCHSFIHNSDFSIDSKTIQNRDKKNYCGSTIQPQFFVASTGIGVVTCYNHPFNWGFSIVQPQF